MKTYIQLICMALIVVINYSCEKKIPVIEHSISGVLYLDHTLQPAANYEVRLQYNSLIYSLRDTKILDECTTDENGRFYLKYVKIAGAGELEIENNGGTALLTEIPVNEDIEFSFPIKPFCNLNIFFNYNRQLSDLDTIFIYAQNIINPNISSGLVYIDEINNYSFMLTSNFQPNEIKVLTGSWNSYKFLNGQGLEKINSCIERPIGFGLNNYIRNDSITSSHMDYTEIDTEFRFYCYPPKYIDQYNQEITIDINLPD